MNNLENMKIVLRACASVAEATVLPAPTEDHLVTLLAACATDARTLRALLALLSRSEELAERVAEPKCPTCDRAIADCGGCK